MEDIKRSMLFRGAMSRVQSMESRVVQLELFSQDRDISKFHREYNAAVIESRQITWALQKEGAHIDGFGTWYQTKQQLMGADPLMKFMNEERKLIEKEGKNRLQHTTKAIGRFSFGSPPVPGARQAVIDNVFWWVTDLGGPNEKRIPAIPDQADDFTVTIYLPDPPSEHGGETIETSNPIVLLKATLTYLRNLVYEAKDTFKDTVRVGNSNVGNGV